MTNGLSAALPELTSWLRLTQKTRNCGTILSRFVVRIAASTPTVAPKRGRVPSCSGLNWLHGIVGSKLQVDVRSSDFAHAIPAPPTTPTRTLLLGSTYP